MGGCNSGRYSGHSMRHRTDDYLKLDIRRWQRDGLLVPEQAFSWQWTKDGGVTNSILVGVKIDHIVLHYSYSKQDKTYIVELIKTPCHLGGARVWFKCPAKGCSRRAAILYGGSIFACRRCHRLVYQTQRQSSMYRALSRAEKLRDRLGWEEDFGPKPTGMHRKTFEKLCDEHESFVDKMRDEARLRFGSCYGRFF